MDIIIIFHFIIKMINILINNFLLKVNDFTNSKQFIKNFKYNLLDSMNNLIKYTFNNEEISEDNLDEL